MKKTKIPDNELDRVIALERYGMLDTPTDIVLDGIAQAAADLCQTPTALISLVDPTRQWVKSCVGMDVKETPRDLAFCSHAILEPTELMVVRDASVDERFCNNPLVNDDPKIRFYAGKPLVTKDNFALGTLCVIDYRPRELSDAQKNGLSRLAQVVMDLLDERQGFRIGAIDNFVSKYTRHGLLITDPNQSDNPIIYANETFVEMTGYSESELIGKNCRLLQGPDSDADTVAKISRAIAAQQTCTVVLKNYRKDGSMFWNELTVSAVKDRSYDTVSMVGVQYDVTDRQLAKERSTELDTTAAQRNKAEDTRNRLAQIVEDSVSEIYVSDADTYKILNANRTARENLGYSVAESQALMPWDFVVGMTPENVLELIEPLRTGAVESIVFETAHRRKDGSIYPVESHVQYMASQNPPVYTSIVQDITERQRQQEKIKLRERAIESLDIGVSITDVSKDDHPLVYVNQTLCKMTGYTPDELLGQGVRILQQEDKRTEAQRKIFEAVSNEEPVQVLIKNTRKDGSHFMGELSLSPVHNEMGKLTHYIGINQDVTVKLDTEARLQQAKKLDAIGQLSGGIAHDFNNMLGVIRGNLELLSLNATSDADLEHFEEALRAVKMSARLTSRLLSFARQSPLEPQLINVNKQVMDVVALLHSSIGETVSLSCDLLQELWCIRVDPSEIENTVVNLVINARDAMPDGGEIILKTDNFNAVDDTFGLRPGEYIKLSVSDNGVGMSDEVKARVFEPFFTTKDHARGTGLGLASIHGFVKQSGGQVSVDSELGQRTTINIYLPRFVEAASLTNTSDQATQFKSTQTKPTQTKPKAVKPIAHILVAEDNDLLRSVTIKRLRVLGFSTAEVNSGAAAVQYLENSTDVDLVFSDIVMAGGMSGYDLASWVQKNMPACPVLLTSGYSHDMADNDINASTAKIPVLQKPASLEILDQAISALLQIETS